MTEQGNFTWWVCDHSKGFLHGGCVIAAGNLIFLATLIAGFCIFLCLTLNENYFAGFLTIDYFC